MVAGALVLASWLITPLRMFWPLLLTLPLPVQLGLAIAALGLLLLVASLIAERLGERRKDAELIGQEFGLPPKTDERDERKEGDQTDADSDH